MSNQPPPRVNIQFSIEMDDLPTEASRLLERSSEYITTATQGFNTIKASPEILTVATWNEIDSLRMALSNADHVLDDLQKILGGYLQMQNEQFASPEAPPAQPAAQNAVPPGHADPTIMAEHPERNTRKASRDQQVSQAQQQLSAIMTQMNNMQNNPAAAMSDEEKSAMDIIEKRAKRVMGTDNEESSGSKEPSV